MTLKIKTETIDLKYTSDVSGITEAEKKHILELLDKVQTKEKEKTTSNSNNNITTEDLVAELVETTYSRTQLINTPQFEQFSNERLERTKKLENLAKILAQVWYYGNFKPQTENEKEMLSIMKDLNYYMERSSKPL